MTASTHVPVSRVGTFAVYESTKGGFWIEDTCRFNNWGSIHEANGSEFATRDAAEDYASRCRGFKTGRRSSV